MNLENSFAEITKKLNSHNEWLLIGASGKSFPLQRGEIEFTFEREKIIFGFLSDAGFQIWRIADCQIENEKITLDLTRNFERECEKIRLVPRISAKNFD
jgi:transcription elongation factor